MTSTVVEPVSAVPEGSAGRAVAAVTAEDLAGLVAAVRGADRLLAQAVVLAGRLAGSGVCERVEGLALDHFVGLAARLTGADRRMFEPHGLRRRV